MAIYDISYPLHAALPVWPGDTPFLYTRSWRIADGAAVNLGAISLSVHAGTHADAPVHFTDTGADIAAADVARYVGPARLLDVAGRSLITAADLAALGEDCAPRLLLRTGGWQRSDAFPTAFPVIDASVPPFLRSRGIFLLGLDVPSVDLFHSKDLPNHHALHANGVSILESLRLAHVPEGSYELIALPLHIVGADGSPVRAILRDDF